MKLKTILTAIALTVLAACGKANDPAADGSVVKGYEAPTALFSLKSGPVDTTRIYGIWAKNERHEGNHSMQVRYRFDPDKVTIAIRCQIDGRKAAYDEVSVAARVLDSEFEILEEKESRVLLSNETVELNCHAGIEMDTFQYELRGGKLIIDDAQDDALTKLSD